MPSLFEDLFRTDHSGVLPAHASFVPMRGGGGGTATRKGGIRTPFNNKAMTRIAVVRHVYRAVGARTIAVVVVLGDGDGGCIVISVAVANLQLVRVVPSGGSYSYVKSRIATVSSVSSICVARVSGGRSQVGWLGGHAESTQDGAMIALHEVVHARVLEQLDIGRVQRAPQDAVAIRGVLVSLVAVIVAALYHPVRRAEADGALLKVRKHAPSLALGEELVVCNEVAQIFVAT